jgi:ArsR family transcriptional regulator, cadmium/lead-responsive transcriptional repressor
VSTTTYRDALTRFGHAISDPTRVEILLQLRDGHGYPSDLAERIGVSKQILSNHLACLRGCGLVVAHPEGRRNRYAIADRRITHALDDLAGLALAVDPACCPEADTRDCC